MKNFLKTLILPIAVVMMLGGFAPKVLAVDPMTATFTPNPIFGAVLNFLPGDIKTGEVIVTNNMDSSQSVYAESVDGFDPDGLGSQLNLTVLENGSPLLGFPKTLSNFLSAGPVSLSSLGGGATKTYTLEVSFINSEDNSYQGKSLGFDLCIGFSGGTFQCGDTVISGEEDTGGGGGGGDGGQIPGGSGGGGSGGSIQLIIFSESVLSVNAENGTAVITWNTNLLSTSQVIYGLAPGPYALNLGILPNFGYPLGTAETATKVTNHSVMLTGLTPGATYLYRVVSRASPPTVSVEHTFTMPTTGTGSLATTIASVGAPSDIGDADEVSGNDTGTGQTSAALEAANEESTSTAEEADTDNNNLLAFALGALNLDLQDLICAGIALLIFLVLLAIIWLISRNSENKPLSRDITLMVIFALIVSLVLWFIPYTCPINWFWIIVVIYIIWKLIFGKRSNDEPI